MLALHSTARTGRACASTTQVSVEPPRRLDRLLEWPVSEDPVGADSGSGTSVRRPDGPDPGDPPGSYGVIDSCRRASEAIASRLMAKTNAFTASIPVSTACQSASAGSPVDPGVPRRPLERVTAHARTRGAASSTDEGSALATRAPWSRPVPGASPVCPPPGTLRRSIAASGRRGPFRSARLNHGWNLVSIDLGGRRRQSHGGRMGHAGPAPLPQDLPRPQRIVVRALRL